MKIVTEAANLGLRSVALPIFATDLGTLDMDHTDIPLGNPTG